jgi:predicted RNase H-like HicB family nuclease
VGLEFKAIIKQEPDGVYSIHVPSLPGCVSKGATRQGAIANIREAILLYFLSLQDDGLSVPINEPKISVEDIDI